MTLRWRVFLVYGLLGALLGPIVSQAVSNLVAPYGYKVDFWPADQQGPPPLVGRIAAQLARPLLVTWLIAFGAICFLLGAIVLSIRSSKLHLVLSISDVFVLAFSVGFGFDFLAAYAASVQSADTLQGIAILPLWHLDNGTIVFAGYHCWLALPAMVWVASRRVVDFKIA